MEEKDKEEQFIGERKLGTLTVDTGTTISAVKSRIFDELIKGKEGMCEELKINSVDEFRLRNAKNSDLGPICKSLTKDGDECLIDEQGLWDNKVFYVQKAEHEYQLYQAFEGNTYNILVRQWHPDTWEFG